MAKALEREEKEGGVSAIEGILELETIEDDSFRGFTREEFPSFDYVYGGQLVGQALAAASKTVKPALVVHSLHSYFLLPGDVRSVYVVPIVYKVERMRDGHTFATRQVSAIQKGKVIFSMYSSFQRSDFRKSFEHQEAMPIVPSPDQLKSAEEVRWRYPPKSLWDKQKEAAIAKCPLDVKVVEPINPASKEELAPWQRTWIKVKGKLTDDPALHRCAAAYASDWNFLETCTRPHQNEPIQLLSLDHSMWFHKPFRADEWLLFVQLSPCASSGRALVYGHFFNQHRELVISTSQEGLMRNMVPINVAASSKL